MRAFAEAASDADRLLELIARRTSEALNACCLFMRTSPEEEWVQTVAAHDPDPRACARIESVFSSPIRRADHPLTARLETAPFFLLSPPPLHVLRARAPAGTTDEHLLALGITSGLVVVMRAAAGPIGWLSLVRHGPNAPVFDDADVELARSLADGAALNLLNARLLAQRERDVSRQAALSAAARDFAAASDNPHELVTRVARRIGDIFDGLCVVRREAGGGETLLAEGLYCTDSGIEELARQFALQPMGRTQGVSGSVLATGRPLIVHDPSPEATAIKAGPFGRFVESAGISSAMYVPLTTRDRAVGIISVAAWGGRRFTAHDLALLEDLGAHAAVALMNSQLLAESRRTEEVLRRGFLDAAPDAVIIAGADGRIVIANRQAETLFGFARAELVGLPIERLVPERFRSGHEAHRHKYVGAPITRPMGAGIDLFALRKDGSEFAAEIMLSPIETAGGVLVAAAVRDVTERRRDMDERNQRMADANRLKSEFLANMSHELRTPLNAIIGFASVMHMGRGGALTERHAEYVGDILTSARHLLQLINDILDLAKVESGRMDLHYESVDLDVLVREVRDIVRGLAVGKRLNLQVEIDPELGLVEVDPRMLKQVLYNYLSNALKFSREQAPIQLRLTREGGDFRLDVEDHGIGIAAENIHRLFIEFQQLEAAPTKSHQGTGLGLALVKRIVEAHKGRVEVTSSLGKGSVFSAVFPRSRPAESRDG